MITSTSNAQVKQVTALTEKAKYRKKTGLFMVEDGKMFSVLPKERIYAAYATEKPLADSVHREMMKGVRKVETVSRDVLRAMSDIQTPQGILALVKQYEYRVEDILKSPGPAHVMIPETIQDPGNLGMVLRAGEGAGITGTIMNNGTADIYNPKVVRSTTGSIYRVSLVHADDLRVTLNLLGKQNIHLCAAHLTGKNSYDEEDYHGGIRLLIRNEVSGLEKGTAVMAGIPTRIPMLGQVESLDVTVAPAILMHGTARQQRKKY